MKNIDEKFLIGSILNDDDADYKIWSQNNTLSSNRKDTTFNFKESKSYISESNCTSLNEPMGSPQNHSQSSEFSQHFPPGLKVTQKPQKPTLKMLYAGLEQSGRNPKRNHTLGTVPVQQQNDGQTQSCQTGETLAPRIAGQQKKHRTLNPTQPYQMPQYANTNPFPNEVAPPYSADCYPYQYYYQQQSFYQPPPLYANEYYLQHDATDDIALNYELDQLCGNQVASRNIQKIFQFGRPDQRELIFNKVERSCHLICKDIFGNYVVQKIFEKGTDSQRMKLFHRLRPIFYELSKNNFGCRVIQKLLEFIMPSEELQDIFLSEVCPQVKTLIHDMYGNYVLLKCLETMQKEKLEFIIKPVEDSVQFMAQQTYGCRIIQKVLEIYTSEQTANVLRITMSMVTQLCFCEYGNYIVQFILRQGPKAEQQIINQIIKDNFEALSLNKYGRYALSTQVISNSVEKFLENMDLNDMKQVLFIMLSTSNNELVFYNLCVNPFGNYVTRRFLIVCDKEVLMPLLKVLRSNLDLLNRIRFSEFGQRVYQILERIVLV